MRKIHLSTYPRSAVLVVCTIEDHDLWSPDVPTETRLRKDVSGIHIVYSHERVYVSGPEQDSLLMSRVSRKSLTGRIPVEIGRPCDFLILHNGAGLRSDDLIPDSPFGLGSIVHDLNGWLGILTMEDIRRTQTAIRDLSQNKIVGMAGLITTTPWAVAQYTQNKINKDKSLFLKNRRLALSQGIEDAFVINMTKRRSFKPGYKRA